MRTFDFRYSLKNHKATCFFGAITIGEAFFVYAGLMMLSLCIMANSVFSNPRAFGPARSEDKYTVGVKWLAGSKQCFAVLIVRRRPP